MTSRLSALKYIKKKRLYVVLILFIIQYSTDPLLSLQRNPYNSLEPLLSVSQNDSSFAPFINPVFSDIVPNPGISYIMQYPDNKINANHYLLIDYTGFIFSYSYFNNLFNYKKSGLESADSNVFTIGKGFFAGNTIGAGINYSFSISDNSNYDNYKSLTLGLIFRPVSFISFGFVSKDINNPKVCGEKTARSDIYSLSIRPFEFITLSVDAVKFENSKFEKSDILFSSNLNLKYEMKAYAGISVNKYFTFGLSIPFGMNSGESAILALDAGMSKRKVYSSNFGLTFTKGKYRASIIESKRFLKIILNQQISEVKVGTLLNKREIIFYDLVHSVNTAGLDNSIAGIILQIDDVGLGFAQIQELREQLKIFKSRGKPLYAVLNAMGNMEYYLASVCTKIYYTPANLFSITGLKAEVFFFKQGMDKLGIKFESVKRGAYKSFPEPYTREHMSREYRENITALLMDLNEQYLDDIENDRHVSKDQINELLNKGLLYPVEAQKAGFIDEIEYPLDAEKKILNAHYLFNFVVDLKEYSEEKLINNRWGPIPEIAVIYASGSIIHGDSEGYGTFFSSVIGDNAYLNALNTAFKNPRVKALIIRVDSGGGSSLASELMWHYLVNLKQQYKKPVIFSFGNMAASGGYYIACTGDRIFSSRGTITGSIGVVTGKLSLKELYGKLGINKDIVKMSEFADIFSEAKDLTAGESRLIEQGVDYVYDRFTDKVSKSRGIEKEHIDKIAEGRVFTGSQAKDNSLIDNYGGLIAAIDLAKKISNIKYEFIVSHLPESPAPIMEFLGLKNNSNMLSKKIETLLQTLELIEFKDELMLYYCPYKIIIK